MKINPQSPVLPKIEIPSLPKPTVPARLETKGKLEFGPHAEALTRLGRGSISLGGEAERNAFLDLKKGQAGAGANGFTGLAAALEGQHAGAHMWAGGSAELAAEAGLQGLAAEAGAMAGVAVGISGQGHAGPASGQGQAEVIAGFGAEAGFIAKSEEPGSVTVGGQIGAAFGAGAAAEGSVTIQPGKLIR